MPPLALLLAVLAFAPLAHSSEPVAVSAANNEAGADGLVRRPAVELDQNVAPANAQSSPLAELLARMPDNAGTRKNFWFNDVAAARASLGLPSPSSEDEYLQLVDALADAGLGPAPWLSGFDPDQVLPNQWDRYLALGILPGMIDQTALAGGESPAPPFGLLRGSFDPAATARALDNCSECLPGTVSEYGGVPIYRWLDQPRDEECVSVIKTDENCFDAGYYVNLRQRFALPASDDLGRGGLLGLMPQYLLWSPHDGAVEALVDSAQGTTASLLDDPGYQLLADHMTALGVYAGWLSSDPLRGPGPRLPWNLVENAEAAGVGVGAEEGNTAIVITLVERDAGEADRAARLLRAGIALSAGAEQPSQALTVPRERFADLYPGVDVWTDGRMVLATVAAARADTRHAWMNLVDGRTGARIFNAAILVDEPASWARDDPSAVWTGSEMLVWGGSGPRGNDDRYPSAGARYDPAIDRWTALAVSGAPAGRSQHVGVWTGSELLVWGGTNSSGVESNGGRYNPAMNTWRPIPTADAPAGVTSQVAVWTGKELIVWGGNAYDHAVNEGARYDPATDTWTRMTTVGAPSPGPGYKGVWTGNELIVWGGSGSSGAMNEGARYNPTTDTWTPIATQGGPDGLLAGAVWTGSEMLVWRGFDGTDGARYNPATNSWAPMARDGAPSARIDPSAVWTGRELLIWGGTTGHFDALSDGARYDPQTDRWAPIAGVGAPSPRRGQATVWTGTEMIVWGGGGEGAYGQSETLGNGARYNPTTNTWRPVEAAAPR